MNHSIPLIHPNWPAPSTIKAFSTTRLGGVSKAPYSSLNLGHYTDDSDEDVILNHKKLAAACDFPSSPCWLKQVHGARVLDDSYQRSDNIADAMISQTLNRVLVVMSADCLPILLYGSEYTEVAAIHGGWRSLSQEIVTHTLSHFKSDPSSIMAWLGPCIGPTAFEVGEEVIQAFSDIDSKHTQAFKKQGQRWLGDLQLLATNQLIKMDIKQIYRDNSCTFNDKERFFSYRRDKTTGRMATFIWLSDTNSRGIET